MVSEALGRERSEQNLHSLLGGGALAGQLRGQLWEGWWRGSPTPARSFWCARRPGSLGTGWDVPEQERQAQWCGHGDHSLVAPSHLAKVSLDVRRPQTWQVSVWVFVGSRQLPRRCRGVTWETSGPKALSAHRAQLQLLPSPLRAQGTHQGPLHDV